MYLVYRWIVALFFLVIIVYSGVVYKHGAKWFIYMTYWAFFLLTLCTVVLAIVATYHYVRTLKMTNGNYVCL